MSSISDFENGLCSMFKGTVVDEGDDFGNLFFFEKNGDFILVYKLQNEQDN